MMEQQQQPQSSVKRKRGRPKKEQDEKMPPRPKRRYRKRVVVPKVPIQNLTKEELEECIFNAELQKLSAINEALLLSNVQHEESDDGVGGGVDPMLDESDVEDQDMIIAQREGDSTCPRPAPRKGRDSRKLLKRNVDSAVSHEEVQGMCQIIRNSMRASLSGSATLSGDSDPLTGDAGNLEFDNPPSDDTPKPESGMVIYRRILRTLSAQEEWLDKHVSSYSTDPAKFVQDLCKHHLRNPLDRQLYIEHLSCLTVLAMQPESPIIENGMLSWFPEFARVFQNRYSDLKQYADGDSGSSSKILKLLKLTTLNVTTGVGELLETLMFARSKLVELMELVDAIYNDKRLSCHEFEKIHDELQLRPAKFDESSIWGMKPIRLALEPPYFKTEDGLLAAPIIPEPIRKIKDYFMCFFKRDKQKWTTKDLLQLKGCIKETLFAKRMSALQDRYEVLMMDCINQYEQDIKREGRLDAPSLDAAKRKRGRPKKSELELTEKYGLIHPVFCVLPNGAIVRYQVSPRFLSEWRATEEKKLKTKSYDELVVLENENIDWETVAVKMVIKSRKHRNAEDCELAFRHEVHPSVNDKRWGAEESRRLKELFLRDGNDWPAVAKELYAQSISSSISIPTKQTQRTAYQCFFRVRNRIEPPKKIAWDDSLDKQVIEKLKDHPGNWRLVAASIDDPASTKRQVIERYKKTINPVLRNGAFTRVEDCLLILTIEKLKPFLAREGHFGCLVAYLPWRCETTWRDRANNLFSDWIVPWTLEEDQMLLDLATTMSRNWQKISEEFTSFKNRKGCLTRYKILMRRLKDERFNNSLEAYHEAYAMTRYNVFQYKHLKEIFELLTKVKQHPLPDEHNTFVGLLRDREPSEVRLQHMLMTFDKTILDSAISSLQRYVETRDNYWKNWISTHGKRKRTFDRRTFHPENPQSVASALHIRDLELKKKEDIPNISDFEDEIYKFYARFKRTKPLKPTTERPYIPDKKTLAEWSAVSRLIATPPDELDDVPVKRKWKSLQSEYAEPSTVKKGKKSSGRVRKVLKKRKVVTKKKGRRGRKPMKKVTKVSESTSQDGYILIPHMKQPKKGRGRSQIKDKDPEFLAVLKTEPVDDQPTVPPLRRSSRLSVRKWNYIDENYESEPESDKIEAQ